MGLCMLKVSEKLFNKLVVVFEGGFSGERD